MQLSDDVSISTELWCLTVSIAGGLVLALFVAEHLEARAWEQSLAQTQDCDAKIADSLGLAWLG